MMQAKKHAIGTNTEKRGIFHGQASNETASYPIIAQRHPTDKLLLGNLLDLS